MWIYASTIPQYEDKEKKIYAVNGKRFARADNYVPLFLLEIALDFAELHWWGFFVFFFNI